MTGATPIAELGRRAKAASRVARDRRRQRARMRRWRPRPTCWWSDRRTSSRPTPPTSLGRRRDGVHARLSSTACGSTPHRIEAWPPDCARWPRSTDPVGEVVERLDSPQRAAHRAGPGPARRRGHHLREPSQRHQRRLRPVPEVGQRRVPARFVGRHRVEHRHRSRPARGVAEGRAARGRAGAGRGHAHTRRPSSSCGCASRSTASSRAAGRR